MTRGMDMDELLNEQLKRIEKERKHRLRWIAGVMILAIVVSFFTTDALTLSGTAKVNTESVLSCAYRCHSHTADCYDEAGSLVCGKADYCLHSHTADCYDYYGVLVCPLPELAPHVHGESCYEERRELVCALEEGEEHLHGEDCYEMARVLCCGLEERVPHAHGAECYAADGALVCGLSLTKLKSEMQEKMSALKQSREMSRAQKAEAAPASVADLDELFADAQDPDGTAPTTLFDPLGDGKTTYIGDRKTTVLKRNRKKAPVETEKPVDAEENADSKTEKAQKKRHPRLSLKHVQPAADIEDSSDAANETPDEDEPAAQAAAPAPAAAPAHEAVPDFLKEAAARAEGKKTQIQKKDASAPAQTAAASSAEPGELPPLSLLESNPDSAQSMSSQEELRSTAEKLQSTLEEFGLTAKVTGWVSGPIVTTFQISMGEGERVSRITNLEDDIALSLAATSVRIFAPIPGTSLVGIEIPNHERQSVCLGDVLPYAKSKSPLEVAFGRDTEGKPITVDIAKLPHLLVAGTTGSGKSVLLNTIIVSMLMRATPQQVRMIMIDPKRVEFTGYNGLPHLYVPVVTDPHQAAGALQWGVSEMERRLKVFEHYKVRDIKTFNANIDGDKWADMEHPPEHMPYFVIVIDELSDLMMVARKDVEASIVRIAQLGRAAGIHLIVATQRPSADVVTGLIKANIDNRVALSVDSSVVLNVSSSTVSNICSSIIQPYPLKVK